MTVSVLDGIIITSIENPKFRYTIFVENPRTQERINNFFAYI